MRKGCCWSAPLLGMMLWSAHVIASPARAIPTDPLLITNVTVVDPGTRQVLTDHDVYIEEGKIVDVMPEVPKYRHLRAGLRVLDGDGGFLVPGFMDMHAHVGLLKSYEMPKYSFELLIANGVTSIRDPDVDCFEPRERDGDRYLCVDEVRALGSQAEAGTLVGPRLLSLSSQKVRGPARRSELPERVQPFYYPETAQEGRALARFLQSRGVDAVKIAHEIHPDAYAGLTEEAGKLGLEIGGHRPYAFTLAQAADMGQRVFDHIHLLVSDCGRFSEGGQKRLNELFRHGGDGAENPFQHQLHIKEGIENFDADRCRHELRELASRGVYATTTIITFADWQRPDDHGINRLISPGRYAFWQSERRGWQADPAALEWWRDVFHHLLKVTRMAHEAGLKLMLGTDMPFVGVVPGAGVHEEMALLSRAGLPPMDVLRSATSIPAEYLGRSDLGGVRPGQIADLVLLEKDPLSDIRHSESLAAVIFGGRVFDRPALGRLQSNVERKVREAYAKEGRK